MLSCEVAHDNISQPKPPLAVSRLNVMSGQNRDGTMWDFHKKLPQQATNTGCAGSLLSHTNAGPVSTVQTRQQRSHKAPQLALLVAFSTWGIKESINRGGYQAAATQRL